MKLNQMQDEAVHYLNGPLLILAGAGSGKTRVLVNRTAYMVENGIDPKNILAITFTNKAAGEMKERVNALLSGGDARQVWISTFHSLCVRILRVYASRLGYTDRFVIFDALNQKTALTDVCRKLNVDVDTFPVKSVMAAISSAKDKLWNPQAMLGFAQSMGDFKMSRIAGIYAEYQKTLKKSNAMDFDDLIMNTVLLFQNHPDVLNAYQERFRYIMVDEYQDTNTAQFVLVSLLADRYKNICVVGDDDQSIYKFRGADITNILNFEKHFPGAKVVRLEQNYRSTQTILNAANAVISHNKQRKEKRLWTDQDAGSLIRVQRLSTGREEASFVVEQVRDGVKHGRKYGDFACLYRTNAQSRQLEEQLVLAGIPYKVVGSVSFYQRREIKDLLSYAACVASGMADEISLKRIINIPRRGIGATTIAKIENFADRNGLALYEAICTVSPVEIGRNPYQKIRNFVSDMEVLIGNGQDGTSVKEWFQKVCTVTGYVAKLEMEHTDEALERIENIKELISKAADFDDAAPGPASLQDFLEEVSLVSGNEQEEESKDTVMLMTIHSAKGLEFTTVFLCGMENGLFPNYNTLFYGGEEELEEERRLCYVAITRAKEELFLLSAKERMINGNVLHNDVSLFLKEIPDEYLDLGVQRSTAAPTNPFGPMKNMAVPAFGVSGQVSKAFSGCGSKPDYDVGDRVVHEKFGSGTVSGLTPSRNDYIVKVKFSSCGEKMLVASIARLQKTTE